jgi:hypothetical protein
MKIQITVEFESGELPDVISEIAGVVKELKAPFRSAQ